MIENESKQMFPILFVDDDILAHKMMEVFLKDWKVFYALSAEDALNIMDKENIQIVITDINMPEMNGIELMHRIKKKFGTTQIIIVTAEDDIEHLINALSAGANDFLLKPLTKDKIDSALENTVQKIARWKKAMKDLFDKNRKR